MKKLFIIVLLPVIVFSCQKEEMKIDEVDDILLDLELKNDSDKGEEGRCFEILFPLSVNMPDGTVISGDTRKELAQAVKEWYKQNGQARKEKISLHFPVGVNFQGKVMRLQNENQLMRIRMACRGDKEGDKDRDRDRDKDNTPCIELLFPVSYTLPSGRTFTANSGEELRKFMSDWKERNPDSRERPGIVYPVNVMFKGKEISVENEEQMIRIKKACAGEKEIDKEKKACFELVFPLTYKMPDGTLISRDSREEMNNAIKRWYSANRSDKKPELQFPVQIRYETERGAKIVDIENQRVLKKAYEDCGK